MRIILYPYRMYSESARALQLELRERGIPCLKVYSDRNYFPKRTDFIINWGASTRPAWYSSRFTTAMLNKPAAVELASNKLYTFEALTSWNQAMPDLTVSIPDWTTNREIAFGWYAEGPVLARTRLTGRGGEGIKFFGDTTPPIAPLYVKYIKKSAEYRVHVMQGEVIDVQQKRHARGQQPRSYQIRNHANGWIFCREDVNPPEPVSTNAIRAIRALSLDFGAVDVVWNSTKEKAYVLEVNTAPGLEGTTLELYANKILANRSTDT